VPGLPFDAEACRSAQLRAAVALTVRTRTWEAPRAPPTSVLRLTAFEADVRLDHSHRPTAHRDRGLYDNHVLSAAFALSGVKNVAAYTRYRRMMAAKSGAARSTSAPLRQRVRADRLLAARRNCAYARHVLSSHHRGDGGPVSVGNT
jgi:hypothetical protein